MEEKYKFRIHFAWKLLDESAIFRYVKTTASSLMFRGGVAATAVASLLRRCGRRSIFSARGSTDGDLSESHRARGLLRQVLALRSPEQSAAEVVDQWARSRGGDISLPVVDRLVGELKRRSRYEHALQILGWMDAAGGGELTARGRAGRLDLVYKVYGIGEAEKYYRKTLAIAGGGANAEAYLSLLRCYVQERSLEKAEALMTFLRDGLLADACCFNEMMKLYMAKTQYEKVIAAIRDMDWDNVAKNALSYHLWLTAGAEVDGTGSLESVLEQMKQDPNVSLGFETYCTAATICRMHGIHGESHSYLRMAEGKLSPRSRLGYSSVMEGYAMLADEEGVSRIWESRKQVPRRITISEYKSAMSCYIKIGCLEEVEAILEEREHESTDVRMYNVLLGAYARKGWMEKAEGLVHRANQRGARPNYKSWEILMEGWMKSERMDRAVEALHRAAPHMLNNGCRWRPSAAALEAMAKHFEENGLLEEAARYVEDLRRWKLLSLPIYKAYLRTHIRADVVPCRVFVLMERERVVLDEEAQGLILRANRIAVDDR